MFNVNLLTITKHKESKKKLAEKPEPYLTQIINIMMTPRESVIAGENHATDQIHTATRNFRRMSNCQKCHWNF